MTAAAGQGPAEDGLQAARNAAGAAYDVARQLLEPVGPSLERVRGLMERERRRQQQIAAQAVAPVDAAFDALQQSGAMMRRQAEALQAAARALDEAAGLMKLQAEQFEHAVAALRRPTELAKAAAGIRHEPPPA